MSERQVLVLLSALVSLAHHIVKVNFLSWKVFGQYLSLCLLSGHRKGSQMLQLRTLFCSSTAGKNVTSVCVIQTSPDQKNHSLILLNPCRGSAQAGLRTLSLLWRQVSFGAGVETSFIWSRCTSVSSCRCSQSQNARQQAEGLDAEPECPLTCAGKGTKSPQSDEYSQLP